MSNVITGPALSHSRCVFIPAKKIGCRVDETLYQVNCRLLQFLYAKTRRSYASRTISLLVHKERRNERYSIGIASCNAICLFSCCSSACRCCIHFIARHIAAVDRVFCGCRHRCIGSAAGEFVIDFSKDVNICLIGLTTVSCIS